MPGDRKVFTFHNPVQYIFYMNSDNYIPIETILHFYDISFLICVYHMAVHFHGPQICLYRLSKMNTYVSYIYCIKLFYLFF